VRRRRGARAVFACGGCVVPPSLSGARLEASGGHFERCLCLVAGRRIRYECHIKPTTRCDIVASLLDFARDVSTAKEYEKV
jgi:hypothetical protein